MRYAVMKLLELDHGRVSLEFDAGEWAEVQSRLSAFGAVARQPQAAYDLIRVGGEEFVLADDWEEPCLLAKTAAGSAMLRQLAESDHGRLRAAG